MFYIILYLAFSSQAVEITTATTIMLAMSCVRDWCCILLFCGAFVKLTLHFPCILLTTYPSRGYVLALIASVYVDLAVLARSFPALSTLPRSVDYILITYVYRHVYLIYLTRGRSRRVLNRACKPHLEVDYLDRPAKFTQERVYFYCHEGRRGSIAPNVKDRISRQESKRISNTKPIRVSYKTIQANTILFHATSYILVKSLKKCKDLGNNGGVFGTSIIIFSSFQRQLQQRMQILQSRHAHDSITFR